jgi:hypothetical protein
MHLYEILEKEAERAYFCFYYSHTMQEDYPLFDLHILQDALMTDYHSVLDFIIQLLGVAGELEDGELLSRSLKSHLPKIRGQVLEMLERSCELKIFRMIIPLISDMPKEERLRAYQKKIENRLTLEALLERLEQSSITVDQIVAATLKCRLNLPNWRTSLQNQLSNPKAIFHPLALELLDS